MKRNDASVLVLIKEDSKMKWIADDMFNTGGYIGTSRSVRSREAISSYKLPISLINKSVVDDFLEEYKEEFTETEIDFLKKTSIAKWKYLAKKKVRPDCWHHTSCFYNETDHYSLYNIAEIIIKDKDTLDEDYKKHQEVQTKKNKEITYGVIEVQIWGGSKKHPKIVGYDEVAGIIIGDWLFYKKNHSFNGAISKYKITANKIEWYRRYDSYAELIKNHVKYKSTKKVFNKLIAPLNL